MKKNIFILTVIFLCFSIIYWGKTGNFLIDFSREAYIPYQLNNGSFFYKDIFLIYGGFGYLFNALLYKISSNINILLILSNICAYIFVLIFYFIATKFIQEKSALLFSILFIVASIFSNSTFSFVVPYSYSTIWGYLGAYLSILFYLNKKYKLLFLTLGFIAINRIELFLLLTIFYLLFSYFEKRPYKKTSIFYLLIFPILYIFTILFEKIPLKDIKTNMFYIKKMINTDSINFLYKSMGAYFNSEYIIKNLTELLIFTALFLLSYLIYKKNFKYTSIALITISLLFFNLNNLFNLAIFVIVILFFILQHKKLLDKKIVFISLCAIILNYKSIFNISPVAYSNFGYIFAVFSIYLMLEKLLDKKWLTIFFIIFTILITILNTKYNAIHTKLKVKTDIGNLYLNKQDSVLFNKTNNYIKENIKNDEDFIVVPEGQIFNLINKKPWKFYNSTFTPLDFETFGEENLIKKLDNNKTDYIIFYPRNTKEYGFQTICYDYGVNFCTYIMDNYKREAIIEEGYKVLIFKKNEK